MAVKVTRSKLVAKLDKVFSEYIRLNNSDEYGQVTCYTCDKRMPWRQSQNGHFFTRGRQNTRWLPENCRVQCVGCNVFLKGNYIIYTRKMIDEIGREELDELERLSKSTNKIPTVQLTDMIDDYTKKVSEMS